MLTCFITVTAVHPLQKQSIKGWSFNSLSINLKALKRDCLSVRYISGGFSIKSASKDLPHSSSMLVDVVSSWSILARSKPFGWGLFWPLTLPCHWEHNLRARESLTFLATIWPKGPWPSNTPQKMVSLLDAKFCNQEHPNFI